MLRQWLSPIIHLARKLFNRFEMAYRLVFLLIMFWSLNAYSKEVATCEEFKDSITKIDVNFFDTPVRIVDTYPFDGLQERRKKDFYRYKTNAEDVAWISDLDVSLGGYFHSKIGADIEYGFTVKPYKGQPNLSCVFVDYIKVDLKLESVIFIDPDYNDLECREFKGKVIDTLKSKNSMPLGEMISLRQELIETLPDIVLKMEKHAVKSNSALKKVDRIKKSFKNSIEKRPVTIHKRIIDFYKDYKPSSELADVYSACKAKVNEHKKYKSLSVDKGQGYKFLQ